jgi:CBS domain-containing protein
MPNISVAEVMTRNPVTISPNSSVLDCAKKMIKEKVGSLLITENKKLVGFLSESDILKAIVNYPERDDLKKLMAVEISSKKLITTKPSESLKEAIEKMKKTKFGRLPVILDGNLVGMITMKDILNFNPELYPELEELDEIKEEENKMRRLKFKVSSKEEEGICEECGNQDALYSVNGLIVCSSCREILLQSEDESS